jgi:thiol-disulfide isomerase/thioredoxin
LKKNFIVFIFSIFLLCSTSVVSAASFGNFNAPSMDGDLVSQDIFSKADLTMVNIWGTFCGPCIKEMPVLAELSQEYAAKGVQIVGIVIDTADTNGNAQQEQMAAANKILANSNAQYVNLVPSYGMLSNQLRVVMAIPTTIFVNKQGEIVGTTIVGSKDKESWIKIIESLR